MTDDITFLDPETGAELYRVPEGATIPKGTPYGIHGWLPLGSNWDFNQEDDVIRFTREPIAPPSPPLPTEPGSLIRAVGTDGDECAMMIRLEDGDWVGVDQDGDYRFWVDESIREWESVTIVPTETWDRLRVLDPEDKRDRVDRHGSQLKRSDFYTVTEWVETLAYRYVADGPLRFADEEVADDE